MLGYYFSWPFDLALICDSVTGKTIDVVFVFVL